MKKMKKMILPVAALSLLAVSVNVALAVEIPNTFSSGETAVAQHVNENFAVLKTAVTDNEAKIADSETKIADSETKIADNEAKTTENTTQRELIDAALTEAETAISDHDARIVSLESGNNSCPSDAGEMVQVGPICVDKYEASVWSAITAGIQYGAGVDDYTCADNGNNCSSNTAATALFARSDVNVMPSSNITWFQAAQACTNVGKRLLTNAEWQVAAAGTLDELGANCNLGTTAAVSTGSSNACLSNWDVVDMVGNVVEWTANWVSGTVIPSGSSSNPVAYGSDAIVGVNLASNGAGGTIFPGAVLRGGGYLGSGNGSGVFAYSASAQPSFSARHIGFRCAL